MRFSRFLWPYIAMVLIIVLIGTVSTYRDWRAYKREQIGLLVDHAGTTATQVDSALLDASRLVDVAKRKFDFEHRLHPITDREAHDLLKNTIEGFRFSAGKELFGLLFYVDQSGIIRAQNLSYPANHIDVSDRLYFINARSKPDQPWHVGEQVVGRTNHQRVFHYAITLQGVNKNFSGVLLQQIKIDATPIFHSDSQLKETEIIATFQGSGHIAFSEPHPRPVLEQAFTSQLFKAAINEPGARTSGWKQIDLNETPKSAGYYLGFVRSPVFDMTTVAAIPSKTVQIDFLKKNFPFFILLVFGLVAVSYLFRRLHKESLARESEHALGLHDPLTNLLNRRALDQELPKLIRDALREEKSISVLFLDIDHFNAFNNKYGHKFGDRALIEVSKAITNLVNRPLDLCCRWGGEEFIVVLPDTDQTGAWHIAESLRNAIKEIKLETGNVDITRITVSIGVLSTRISSRNTNEDLIKLADKLMYKAKLSGRDCCRSNFLNHADNIS
ncbi:MAG: diguanylate cyclase [Fluviibacter sp.]